MFLVGKILGTHGIKGELKVKSDTSFNRFEKGSILYIETYPKKYYKIVIDSHRVHQDFDLISFNGFANINDVLEFVGKDLYVKNHEKKINSDKLYYEEIIDCVVFDEEGNEHGMVNDIIEVPQGILLEIVKDDKTSLVPYVKEFVLNVDVENKKILLHLIEGLL